MKSRDYKKVLSNAEHFCFDECNSLFAELKQGDSILNYPDHIKSMTYVVKNEESKDQLKAYFDFIIIDGLFSTQIKWTHGKILYKNIFEGLYYNLINYKKTCENTKTLDPIPETFYFLPTKIVAK